MGDSQRDHVTELLTELSTLAGLAEESVADVAEKLMPLVYDELHALAQKFFRRERPDHTLQPTALVHEAYLRLVDQSRIDWQGRTHFCAVAARAMRHVLIDHARARGRERRGGQRQRVLLDSRAALDDLAEIDAVVMNDLLERLAQLDPRQARVVELRFFGGLSVDEVAQMLGTSKRTVEGDWTHAKAWLRNELQHGASA